MKYALCVIGQLQGGNLGPRVLGEVVLPSSLDVRPLDVNIAIAVGAALLVSEAGSVEKLMKHDPVVDASLTYMVTILNKYR